MCSILGKQPPSSWSEVFFYLSGSTTQQLGEPDKFFHHCELKVLLEMGGKALLCVVQNHVLVCIIYVYLNVPQRLCDMNIGNVVRILP